ncbi:hypothetical protein HMPREF3226_00298 [Prevotella corporis]|uniref:Uncharacterized protein n=1 Tax=Prevotella corporis TaxID=28128 RepID=A0A133QLW4_9BACT|nr:hypothetical protein HMPREF3226_00298 [Prevotella corporis]
MRKRLLVIIKNLKKLIKKCMLITHGWGNLLVKKNVKLLTLKHLF